MVVSGAHPRCPNCLAYQRAPVYSPSLPLPSLRWTTALRLPTPPRRPVAPGVDLAPGELDEADEALDGALRDALLEELLGRDRGGTVGVGGE